MEKHSSGIPILTYHSLDGSGSVVSTSPDLFERQMETLWRRGYRAVSLGEAVSIARESKAAPAKTFVITFDDGYENVYTKALQVLTRFGFKATVFLITDYCGKQNDWPGQPMLIQRLPLLSWSQIGEMLGSGFEFGVHTATHPDLTRIPVEQAEIEIVRSQVAIQDKLGVGAEVFAYPYGKFDSRVLEIVRARFSAACSTRLGKARPGGDPHLLRRIDMFYLSNPRVFDALSSDAFDSYLSLRQSIRALREVGWRLTERFSQREPLFRKGEGSE